MAMTAKKTAKVTKTAATAKTAAKPAAKTAAKTETAPATATKTAAPAAKTAAPAAKTAAPAAKTAATATKGTKAATAPAGKPGASGGGEARPEAPGFKLTADDGSTVSLADFAGKSVVLFFYPKDNTPGCTREACAFQENLDALREKGAVLLGVSRDSTKSHVGFKSKFGLAYPLLSDPDAAVHKAYGAWGTKTSYGRETTGALRSTVIIDPSGRIAKRFPSVKVDGHADQVLAALDAI
jgi:peroxiredoxin Q/BCP